MKVYIVEDNESMRIIIKRFLRKKFPSITSFGESENAESALLDIPHVNPHLVIVDISLPGMDGIELIRRLRVDFKTICILVMTGHEVDLYKDAAFAAGADDIVAKDDDDGLLNCVGRLLNKYQ